MRPKITRRSALIGFGALASVPAVKGCGGGGDGSSSDNRVSTNPPSTPSASALPGSIWYVDSINRRLLKVNNGGLGEPVAVRDSRGPDARVDSWSPRISRRSPRYILFGLYGATSDTRTVVQIYDHATNQPYCYVDAEGYSDSSLVSPSGNFVGMRRSPELVNDSMRPNATSIAGLTIVDISNPNDIRAVRSDYLSGRDAVAQFRWLDDDRFLYVTKDLRIVTGAADSPPSSDRVIGSLNLQGLGGGGGIDLHPDGTTMLLQLVTAGDENGDIYLYKVTGEPIDRVTSSGQGKDATWSPDGSSFMFKYGGQGCTFPINCSACTSFYAPAAVRNLAYGDAKQFDQGKVPCTQTLYWSAIA
jgi:hypothetical protein